VRTAASLQQLFATVVAWQLRDEIKRPLSAGIIPKEQAAMHASTLADAKAGTDNEASIRAAIIFVHKVCILSTVTRTVGLCE